MKTPRIVSLGSLRPNQLSMRENSHSILQSFIMQ